MPNKLFRKKRAFAWILGLSMLLSAAAPAQAAAFKDAPADTPNLAQTNQARSSKVTGTLLDSPTGADLTLEGNLDWVQFDTNNYADYNRKNISNPLIQNVVRETINQADERYSPTDTLYSFTDGTRLANGTSNAALVMVNEGASLEFSLPASTGLRYVKIYTGSWASDLQLTLRINGQIQYTETYSQPEPDKPGKSQVFSLQYQTADASDEVKVRIEILKTYSSGSYRGNATVQAVTLADRLPTEEKIATDNWDIKLSSGSITQMQTRIGGEMVAIPMNEGQHKLQWLFNGHPIALSQTPSADSLSYSGTYQENGADLSFSLKYHIDADDNLVLSAGMTNHGSTELSPKSASLNLGFNTYLANYPEYEEQLFPTLLRCEKTHLWGYFSSPSGKIMTIATDQPVASYTLNYQPGQHRIYGATLDLLHEGPLPERHPTNCGAIGAGETKEWNIYLKPMEHIRDYAKIKESLADATNLPVIDADHYTVSKGETSRLKILSGSSVTIEAVDPDGVRQTLAAETAVENVWLCSLTLDKTGVYKLLVTNEDGYTSEAMLTCRMPWSWYLAKARQAAIDAPQKGSTHIESYLGLYSGFLARKYFPDTQADIAIDEKLNEIYPLMYNTQTGLPTVESERIQNHSGMLGILVDKYQASGDFDALERAVILAGHVMSRQKADGGYYDGNTDYTSVIYPAKSIMELMYVERELSEDTNLSAEDRNLWQERYETHLASVTRAMDNLVKRDGALETEGQGTFEDGANSCSYTQLSEFALFFPKGSAKRQKYTDAALSYLGRHVSHQQLLIPDSRMNGGTLRFWEAQYDVEMGLTNEAPNMMNSPHGWTAWSIYGYFNLYELTGNEAYLRRGMNALGSCAQLMDFDGTLRWAFVGDPYRSTNLFVYDKENSTEGKIAGKHVSAIIGEQYVDMISTWWRAPKNTLVNGYQAMNWFEKQGSACDNDVHEVFKCMAEVALTKAYLAENPDGSFEAYNCTVETNDDKITVIPAEEVVSNVSIKLNQTRPVTVRFYNGDKTETIAADTLPVWISTDENCTDIKAADRNSSLASLTASQGTLSPAFDPSVTDYTLKLRPDADRVTLTPAADAEHAAVLYDSAVLNSGESVTIDTKATTVDKTVAFRVTSESLASSTVYQIRILKGSVNENVASGAKVTADGATGTNNDPAALTDGKKDDHTDKTTLTLNTNCPQEILFTWDQPQNFDSVILWAWYATEQAPSNWDIQVTYDGKSWTTVAQTGDVPWQYSNSQLESFTSEFDEVKNAVGLKLIINSGNTTWGHFAINEVEIMKKTPVADTSALLHQLTAANGYLQEHYEPEGWDAFAVKRTEAQTLLSGAPKEQSVIDTALKELTEAMAALKKKPTLDPDLTPIPNPNPDSGQPSTPTPTEQPLKTGTVKLYKGIYYKVTKSSAANKTVAVQKAKKSKKNVVIPAQITLNGIRYKVTAILDKAFQKDQKLTSITFGSNITSIGKQSFYNCKKLKTLQFKNKKAVKIGRRAFTGTAKKATVKIPKGMKNTQVTKLQKSLKQAGISSKASVKKVK